MEREKEREKGKKNVINRISRIKGTHSIKICVLYKKEGKGRRKSIENGKQRENKKNFCLSYNFNGAYKDICFEFHKNERMLRIFKQNTEKYQICNEE